MANDESFRDPTNLENKLQKHQEFEAEVNANEQRIQNIAQVTTFLEFTYFIPPKYVHYKPLRLIIIKAFKLPLRLVAVGGFTLCVHVWSRKNHTLWNANGVCVPYGMCGIVLPHMLPQVPGKHQTVVRLTRHRTQDMHDFTIIMEDDTIEMTKCKH